MTGKVIIYYWPGTSSIRKVNYLNFVSGPSFGHTAIEVIPDEERGDNAEYISFWPGTCLERNRELADDGYICRENTTHFHTKDQDHYIYNNELPQTVILTHLDADSIIESYKRFKDSNFKWDILGSSFLSNDEKKNCVGLSLMLLHKGGFQKYIKNYYGYGLVVGSATALPLMSFLFLEIASLFYLMVVPGNENLYDANIYIYPAIMLLGSLSGIAISSGVFNKNQPELRRKTKGLANGLGALLFMGMAIVDSVLFSIFNNKNGDHKCKFLALCRALWTYSNQDLFRQNLKIFAFAFLGAYIGGTLVKTDVDKDALDPGFIAGFTALIPGTCVGIATGLLMNTLERFLAMDTIDLLGVVDKNFEYSVTGVLCVLLATGLSTYTSSKILNYLVYESVSTPKDLHRLSTYASHVEKNESLQPANLEDKANSNTNLFFKSVADNKGKLLIGAGLVATIGFFAWKEYKIPININDGIGSIAYNTFRFNAFKFNS